MYWYESFIYPIINVIILVIRKLIEESNLIQKIYKLIRIIFINN